MSAVLRSRPSLLPLVVAATAGVVLVPATIPSSTPNALAARLVSQSQAIVESSVTTLAAVGSDIASVATRGIQLSAAGLLAQSPTVLQTVDVADLAHFVALPQATVPLVDVLGGSSGGGAALRSALAPTLLAEAAADPTADLFAALQSAFGKITDAISAAPGNVITSIGQLLDGDLRSALQTFSNIVIQPLVLIGLVDLPNITAPLAKLAPFFAPVINAIPNIAINISVTALQLFIDGRDGFAATFEGVRDGLKAGDLGLAASNFLSGLSNIAQQGFQDVFGPNGIISALVQSGNELLQAITQIGAPVAASTEAVSALSAAKSAPSAELRSAQSSELSTAPSGAVDGASTTKPASQDAAGAATDPVAPGTEATAPEATAPEATAPEVTAPDTTKPETKPDTTTSEPTTAKSVKPESTKPTSSKPDTTKPDTTKPASTGSESSKPASSKPGSSKPESSKPESSKSTGSGAAGGGSSSS